MKFVSNYACHCHQADSKLRQSKKLSMQLVGGVSLIVYAASKLSKNRAPRCTATFHSIYCVNI